MEQKKKEALDKKKPFELQTDKRMKEKEEKQQEHPVLGKLKVVLGPNRKGVIVVREGDDPRTLAENFISSYAVAKKDHKESVIRGIQQILDQYANKSNEKYRPNESSSSEYENRSMSNDLKAFTEDSELIREQNYFNIPVKAPFTSAHQQPIRPPRRVREEIENENPNDLMSPHFRGESIEHSSKIDYHPGNFNYESKKSPDFKPSTQSEGSRTSSEKVNFVGFSPESSDKNHGRSSVANSFYVPPIENTKVAKRSCSKQSNYRHPNPRPSSKNRKGSSKPRKHLFNVKFDIGNGNVARVNV